ncbi:MAG: heavy metal-associated domain-containing protein, partial [Gemmatimonadota bacterium]
GGMTVVCPPCEESALPVAAQTVSVAQPSDTATTRLHISGMTCATCPVTARVALKKLAGVYDAKVTLDDSLGVVRYDPRRVSPAQIAAHLTDLTGYRATVLPDSVKPPGDDARRQQTGGDDA